ncbi:MAG: potassium channel protein [Planctomycetes bacterium]|nr:potassium channel protein [Planctomycetota bacterium]
MTGLGKTVVRGDRPSQLTRWLLIFLLLLAAVVVISTSGYCLIERQSLFESLYITVITISTVGSREIPNISPAGQLWTIAVIIFGVGTAMATFSLSVAALTEGTIRKALGRRQVQRAIKQLTGHVIVCGFGRMGQLVLNELRANKRDAVAVEISDEPLARPENAGVLYVQGDAQDEAVLLAAGIERAGHLVACLPQDADNVFLTLTARQLNQSLTIIARAEQPSTQNKLLRAGANRVICPQIIGATRIIHVLLRPAVVDFVEVANKGVDLEMDQLVVPKTSELVGKTLRALALPARTGTTVVAVLKAGGRTVYNPGPELTISAGDTLILVGQTGCAVAVQKLQAEHGPEGEA